MSTINVDTKVLNTVIASIESLHARLDAFEKAQSAQHALNDQFYTDLHTIRSMTLELQQLVSAPTPSPATPVIPTTPVSPTISTASPTTSTISTAPPQQISHQQGPHPQARPQQPQWTEVIHPRRREHALRTLQPPPAPTDTPKYTSIHLYRSHQMSLQAYRNNLTAIGIDSK